jgi:hypothetical protein
VAHRDWGYSSAFGGGAGAAWVYTRSGTSWKQQQKLVGTPATANANQGYSVTLSSDGNTGIVGGPGDSGNTGAALIYTRSGTTWTQHQKHVGTGAIGTGDPFGCQGTSVALSPDGKIALVGGPADDALRTRRACPSWAMVPA